MNLQYRMILDYTARVERLHLGKHPTELTVDVANYIQHHMSELITAEKIAEVSIPREIAQHDRSN